MGGCCCSSRKPHLHGTPVYYYCPPALEEHGSLTSHNGAASAFTAGLLVELHLNTSTPDTFRPPPAPLPYDVILGCPQSPYSESVQETISRGSFGTLATCEDLDELDCKTQASSLLVSPRKSEVTKLHEPVASATEEEDACPICLEEYDLENPKHLTNCEHHFHLSCILEWMERSDTCPICDQGQLIIYAVPLEKFRGKGMKFSKTWEQVSLCSCPLVLVNTLVASYEMDLQTSTRLLNWSTCKQFTSKLKANGRSCLPCCVSKPFFCFPCILSSTYLSYAAYSCSSAPGDL